MNKHPVVIVIHQCHWTPSKRMAVKSVWSIFRACLILPVNTAFLSQPPLIMLSNVDHQLPLLDQTISQTIASNESSVNQRFLCSFVFYLFATLNWFTTTRDTRLSSAGKTWLRSWSFSRTVESLARPFKMPKYKYSLMFHLWERMLS